MNNLIDEILVINLDHRTDRWDHFKKQAINSDIINTKYRRISAIDGNNLQDQNFKDYVTENAFDHIKNKIRTGGLRLSYGAIGLALTYKNILQCCTNNILLLEDDIIISNETDNVIASTILNVPNDWDIIYFGWYDSPKLVIEHENNYVNKIGGKINGTQAWMINAKSAQKILSLFPLKYQIDTEIYLSSDLIKYCSKNKIISKASFKSDIQIN